ncbi:response regulator [Fodinicurvata sp. EGI_FJ10296]|uniref:response regulator n=1 Tax=Fodinicurvata sp. EGI_FJ10296 TaxID=3231908 RepID=UPI003454C026
MSEIITFLMQTPAVLGLIVSALILAVVGGAMTAVLNRRRGQSTAVAPPVDVLGGPVRRLLRRIRVGQRRITETGSFDPDRADANAVFRNIAIWGDESQPMDLRHRALHEARSRLNRLADTILAAHAAESAAASLMAADTPKASRRTEILLVDDEATLRDLTALSLREMGFIVHRADNAEEAMAIIAGRSGNIDLVLSDVVMPGASGPELAGEIARTHPEIPVMFMSGYEQRRLAKERMIPPAMLCLSKPFTLEELLAAIRDVLASRRHHIVKT